MKKSDLKSKSLKEHGTLNPEPDKVTAPLFKEKDFFDPRDLIQVKYEMLRNVREDGQHIAQAASAHGFSRPSYYKHLRAFERGGFSGLLPEKRGPRNAHKLSLTVMDFVIRRLEEVPSLSTSQLADLINKEFGFTVHSRSIERALMRSKKKKKREQ